MYQKAINLFIILFSALLLNFPANAQDGRWVVFDLSTIDASGVGYSACGDGLVCHFPSSSNHTLIFDIQFGEWQAIELADYNDFDYYDCEGHLVFAYSMTHDLLFAYSDIGMVWDTIYVEGDILDYDDGFGWGENLAYFITDQYLYIFDAEIGEWVSYAYSLPADYTVMNAWVMDDFVGVVFSTPNPKLPKNIVYSYHTKSFNQLDDGAGYNPNHMDHGFAGAAWNVDHYRMIGYSAYDNQFSIETYIPTDEFWDEGMGPFFDYERKVDEFTTYMLCFRYPVSYSYVNANHFAYDTRHGVWVHQYTNFDWDFEGYSGNIICGGQMASDNGSYKDDDSPHYILFDGTNNVYRSPWVAINLTNHYMNRGGGICFLGADSAKAWGYNLVDNLGNVMEWMEGYTANFFAGQDYVTATRWNDANDDMRTYFYNARNNDWTWIDIPEHWNHHNGILTAHYYMQCSNPENEAIFYSSPLDQILYHDFADVGTVFTKIRGDLGLAAGDGESVLFNGLTGHDIIFSANVATHSQNGLGTHSAVFSDPDDHTLYGYSMKSNTVTSHYMAEDPFYCVDTGYVGIMTAYYNGNGFNKIYTYNSMADSWIEFIPEGNYGGTVLVGKRTAIVPRQGIGYNPDLVYAFDPQREFTEVAEEEGTAGVLPAEFALEQNYPNPFNPLTVIKYSIPYRSEVSIDIFNILGQKVRTLKDNETHAAGTYKVAWNGTGDDGQKVSSGMYFYRLKAGEKVLTKKMLMVK